MIRTILKYVAIGMVLLLIILWLWTGGWGRVVSFVKTIPNPIDIIWGTSTSTYEVKLPWALPVPQGPDIELYLEDSEGTYGRLSEEERVEELQREYERLQGEVANAGRSPHAGKVSLSRGQATDPNFATEYVVINAYGGSQVSMRGWSLASMLSGVRVMIPPAADVYQHGTVNAVDYVRLEPGTSAIVATGFSPAGVSFRENRCSGYLAQTLSFDPPLANACPSPAESLSLTDQNLQRYGGECIDYVRALPQCTFPTTIPVSLPAACRIYVANTFSYNGCVQAHRNASDFKLDTWRLYIGSRGELWRNDHESIRLLDENGLTIDSITY